MHINNISTAPIRQQETRRVFGFHIFQSVRQEAGRKPRDLLASLESSQLKPLPHSLRHSCFSPGKEGNSHHLANPITSQALMRRLLCQTLRSLCDKAPPWVNNEWRRPINSKFDCIFCFLNMKEDRSSRGNEPCSTGSQSLLSTSRR